MVFLMNILKILTGIQVLVWIAGMLCMYSMYSLFFDHAVAVWAPGSKDSIFIVTMAMMIVMIVLFILVYIATKSVKGLIGA